MAFSLPPGTDPLEIFGRWVKEARVSEPNDADAMALASCDRAGRISQRMMLMKGYSEQGFCFYTNFHSDKAKALLKYPQAALLFHWKSLRRQVRIEGVVERVLDREADAYFATRPRGSQIGAWASDQSALLDSRETLEQRIAAFTEKYHGQDVPRPPHWSGFLLRPDSIELWSDGADRLHDRVRFSKITGGKQAAGKAEHHADYEAGAADVGKNFWRMQRLYP